MNIPLDNLYHYINGLFTEPVCIYLFYPHGSRNILHLKGLNNPGIANFHKHQIQSLIMICHDQEPLNYKLYLEHPKQAINFHYQFYPKIDLEILKNSNIGLATHYWTNRYQKIILLHSEKNSNDLDWYENNGYVGAHYWAHAVIAKDWFRFAEFDTRFKSTATTEKDFLIYSRDWSGLREYRIKFQELLFNHKLTNDSITSIKKINDQNVTVDQHTFKNLNFKPKDFDFLNLLEDNNFDSDTSALYVPLDFNLTNISVVLETVFDGSRIHLTEKTLRPLACGHPFILAAGPRSLEYLKSYGFKTFSPWIDENYDLEEDSLMRLEKIIYSMKKFNNLGEHKKNQALHSLKKIANYNRNWFFSKKFTSIVHDELKNNLSDAANKIKFTNCS
jgi:hypothetical protein